MFFTTDLYGSVTVQKHIRDKTFHVSEDILPPKDMFRHQIYATAYCKMQTAVTYSTKRKHKIKNNKHKPNKIK